jgi:hypothetical protein
MPRLDMFPARARLGRALVVAAALAVLLAGPARGAPEDHRAFPPPGTAAVYGADRVTPVQGAWSLLARTPSGLAMVIHTVGLAPGHAYAAWWIVFNAPAFCADPSAATGARCGNEDLPANEGDPRAGATMAYATGHVVDGAAGVRTTDFAAWLPTAAWGGAVFGPGLLDPAGAEIHLILTDLGPAVAALDAYQLRAFADGCAGGATAACPAAQVSFQLP